MGAVEGARFWADRAGDAPLTSGSTTRYVWRGRELVEEITVHGGNHQLYSCCARGQRFLGSTPHGVDVSDMAWAIYQALPAQTRAPR